MYLIDQEIANMIARTQKMRFAEMRRVFSMPDHKAEEWEVVLKNRVEQESGLNVAKIVEMYLPLYLENTAITSFIRKFRAHALRRIMPEITSVEEILACAKEDGVILSEAQESDVFKWCKIFMTEFKTVAEAQPETRFDSEFYSNAIQCATSQLQSGAIKFEDFAKNMIAEFDEQIKPLLKSLYMAVVFLPSTSTEISLQMDGEEFVRMFDLNKVKYSI